MVCIRRTTRPGKLRRSPCARNNIKTPGTPEAKRFEEVLAKMPEVQAYERQQKRVEEAQQAVDETEAALP